jgi:hypothetical protein
MNKQSNLVKILIPVVAVIVLAESVILISNLSKNNTNKTVVNPLQVTTPTVVTKEGNMPAYQVTITSTAVEMKLNKTETVEVKAVGNSNRSLDSVNVYLKYDPTAFEVTNLVFDKKLPAPTFSKVSQTTGLIVANFLISAPEGLKISSSDVLSLMKFGAKPIKTGVFTFEVSTGNEGKESTTMFVENATGRVLPFSSSKLTVNVSR